LNYIKRYRFYLVRIIAVLGIVGTFAFAHAHLNTPKVAQSTEGNNTSEIKRQKESLTTTAPQDHNTQAETTVPSTTVDAPKNTNQVVTSSVPVKKVSSIPILYYHSILTEPGNELRMPPEQFDAQMKYLFEHGYQVITLDHLYNSINGNENLPDKPIVINFDDGYVDNYTNAYPILQKYNFVATVFMVSSYVNGTGFLTADQLRTLQSSGWTIGGHTENHTDLSKTNSAAITDELKNSRKALESIIGQPLKYFAYPYGGYNSDAVNKVKQDGYKLAVTTMRGWASSKSSPFLIKRVYCYADMEMSEFVHRITNPNY
jgi:peptidoglycan/xylan/chitin deacetylase (PgdA/CDA1 family)